MKNLRDKVVLITGAGGGIGRALAHAFAAEGCGLVLCDKNQAAVRAAAAEVEKSGARALALRVDVSDEKQVAGVVIKSAGAFPRIDIVVCNAGIGWTGPTHLMSRKDWDTVFNVNFFGVVNFIRQFVPGFIERRQGHVVITSSIFGITGLPYGTLYAASKAALIALGECLRSELSFYGIGVTTVCPGLIATDLTATTRFKGVDEAARELPSKIRAMSPEKCAAIIVRSVKRNRGVVVITLLAKIQWGIKRLSQRLYEFESRKIAGATKDYIRL